AALIAEGGVAPPVPRLPAAALKQLKGDKPNPDQPEEGLTPEKLADRIQENTKAAADRLAGLDHGDETRRKQDQALRVIDELLKKAENTMGGKSGDQSKENKDQSNQGSSPRGGGSPGGGGSPKGGGQPKGSGAGQQAQKQGSWRDRRNQEQGGG